MYEHPVEIWIDRVSGEVLLRCVGAEYPSLPFVNGILFRTQAPMTLGSVVFEHAEIHEEESKVRTRTGVMLLKEFDKVFDSRGFAPSASGGACTCPMNTLMTQGCTCKGK